MASKGTQKNKVSKHSHAEVAGGVSKAELTGYNQAPRKVRLVANLVRGKSIKDAMAALSFLPKRAALPIKKLIESAAANAKTKGEDPKKLTVIRITVDSAGQFVRYMPRAMGRATPIRKKRSRVVVELAAKS